MILEKTDSAWYSDGMEAIVRLYFRSGDQHPPYLVEVIRPCCESFVSPRQHPAGSEPLICILPRETFTNRETILIRVEAGHEPETILWEGQASAAEVAGEPRLEFRPGREELDLAA